MDDEVVAADVRAWCTMNDTTYQTVTKKLDDYKVGRGKWNLTVKEQLEQTYEVSCCCFLQCRTKPYS